MTLMIVGVIGNLDITFQGMRYLMKPIAFPLPRWLPPLAVLSVFAAVVILFGVWPLTVGHAVPRSAQA